MRFLCHHPHSPLCFFTPASYHPYAPAAPSSYASDASTPSPPHPSLCFCTPPHLLHSLPSLHSCIRAIGYGGLNSAPESGSEISDMVSSHELGIEVESLSHETNPDPPVLPECEHRFILNICNISNPDSFFIAFISTQPPSSQKTNFKSYEKETTVELSGPTEDAGQDDIIFSGKVEIISKEPFIKNCSNNPKVGKNSTRE
ncbi:hypothetical protein O181_018181 [Austropuccinia psidii MF-1]|uniref:Uncharacterized protein n=1 Tax=Austropuccinia psidii MF-1 TaxID=1389203 RepID=A0A9Q3GSP4_9BASI|nr:hypothetical protein [Austropuccinia psidii MF-1]